MSITLLKKLQRVAKGLCTNCGHKPCTCKVPKHFRGTIPDVLLKKRVKNETKGGN